MSTLEFSRLIIRNFKEYRGKHVLDLSAMGNGLHYIRGKNRVDAIGSNGSGKSTLWDAFMWCLTGRTVRGLRGTDVRTWGGTEPAVSRVDFFRDDEAHHVKRSTAKNGLWLDGKLASQEEIDRLIGLSIINIPHTIILGQKQDLFFDLVPSKKLEILSETLNLDKWDTRSKRAKDKAKALETELFVQEQLVAHITMQIKHERTALEEQKQKAEAWERERSASGDKLDAERATLVEALTKATKEVGPHDLAYDSAETELRAIRKDLIKKQEQMDDINDKLLIARSKRDARANEYQTLRELSQSGTCPTCHQQIKSASAHAKEAKSLLKEAKHRRDVASDRVIIRETQKELLQKAITIQREAERAFGEKSNTAKDKLDHVNERIAQIKQEIAVIKARSREEEVNPYANGVTTARNQIKIMKRQIEEARELADKFSRRIIRTKYWIEGFKQIRLYLLQEALLELQEVTQNTLPSLGLTGWVVEYDIERETKKGTVSTGLSVRILKPGMEKAVRWEAWSGGEGQRLLIAGAMALSEVLLRHAGIECDLLVLDEPTRHMSKEGVADTVDYLVERGRDGQVFYVDHQVVESNRFASVITIEKDDDGSKITT
jgi:DNA repair exonuclease SbcCD ATPase subunit